MKKTVQSVKNSLKFKAQPRAGILSVRVGVKKFSVPVEARMLSNGNFVFLSFPASSELYRVDMNRQLQSMGVEDDATEAFASLNPGKRRTRRRTSNVSMPEELAAALRALPSGYKLGYGLDGVPKLVRTRKRTRSRSSS